MKNVFLFLTVLAITLVCSPQRTEAQVIDGTLKCSVGPTCLAGTTGTVFFLQNEVTAYSTYNGNGYSLDACSSVAANGCSVAVIGTVSGAYIVNSSSTYYIGIIFEATGAVGDLEGNYWEVDYADDSFSYGGGGSYPC